MKEIKQLFIIGAPRSGTTYLARLLEKSVYKRAFETHFIVKYYKKLSTFGELSNVKNFARLLIAIQKERPILQLNLDLNAEQIFQYYHGNPSYTDLVNYICLQANASTMFWGDKTPHYIENLAIIHQLFPAAKFVYIVRDGRDVALSLLKKEWGPNNIYSCAKYWQRLNKPNALFKDLQSNKQLIQVSYEQLISDPELLPKIYQFLDMPAPHTDYKKDRYKPIVNNFNKWEKQLTKKEIKIFEQVAGETLLRFNYQIEHKASSISALKKLAYNIHDKLFYYIFMFNHNVIDSIKIRFFNKQPFED